MQKSLRILFVRPKPSPLTIGLQHVMVVEPLELEVLAALADPGDTVEIVDMILEKQPVSYFIRKFKPDVFCVTGYITHIPQMIRYCRIAKSIDRQVVTVAGGVHLEKCPGDCLDEAVDFRIVRNATRLFPKLLGHLRNGGSEPLPAGIVKGRDDVRPQDLPEYDFFYPFPQRELTNRYRKNYFYVFHDKVALLKTSFGCPHSCSFCFCREITGGIYHQRPLEDVMQELEMIKEREIYIVDDIFLCHAQRVKDFISELQRRKMNKRFLVYGRADFITSYPDIVRDFQKVGLRTIIIGLESFNDSELHDYNKKILSSTNQQAMKILNEHGVDCYAAIILSPSWGYQDFIALQKELKELKIRFVNLQPLTPLPLTGVHVPEEDLVVQRNMFPVWDLAHVMVKPQKISVPEYYRMIIRTYTLTIFRWSNLFVNIRYPLYLQLRLAQGISRVYRQYRSIMKETLEHA